MALRSLLRLRRRRIVVIALLLTFVGGPLFGWIYERYAVRRDARRFPPPGQFVNVGSRKLHYVCIGGGSPLVLFEMSGFSNSMSFVVARSEIASQTRVCSYDRMGMGWSDPGPAQIPVSMLAADLGAVLNELSPHAKAIVVASSMGGFTAEYFARLHPDRLAGLVFVDAGNAESAANLGRHYLRVLRGAACSATRAAGAVGLIRLFDPWQLRRERTEQGARSAALMYGSKPWVMLCALVRAGETTLREFAEAPPLSKELPVTALSAETREGLVPRALTAWIKPPNVAAELRRTHQHLAEGSAHGVWKIVPGSDHLIASSQPQAVVDEVLAVIRLKPDSTR